MRPEDLVRFVIALRDKSSRVAVHKIIYLTDNEFVRRRIAANIILKLLNSSTKIRNETGLKYYRAKLGPFSTRIQNAIKRLLKSGEIDEIFYDGRFVYVAKNLKEPKVKEYIARVIEKYSKLPDEELIELAINRSKFDPTVFRILLCRFNILKEKGAMRNAFYTNEKHIHMGEDINLREIARRVADGEYDSYLRNRYVGKRLKKSLSGYLNGVKKTIALLLYAADKEWVRLTDATRDLYISRSSAHKLLRRKLIEEGYVEVVKEGKRMKYRLTEKGKELAMKLAEELSSVSPEVRRRSILDEIEEKRRLRAKEIEEKAKLPADVHVRREE